MKTSSLSLSASIVACALGLTSLLSLMSACGTQSPPALMHRQPWEVNHGQGRNPAMGHCPQGTREYFIYTDEGVAFFLECQR